MLPLSYNPYWFFALLLPLGLYIVLLHSEPIKQLMGKHAGVFAAEPGLVRQGKPARPGEHAGVFAAGVIAIVGAVASTPHTFTAEEDGVG